MRSEFSAALRTRSGVDSGRARSTMNSPGSCFIGGTDDGSSFFDVVRMPCMASVAAMPAAAPRTMRWASGRGKRRLRIIKMRARPSSRSPLAVARLLRQPDRVAVALHTQAGVRGDLVQRLVPRHVVSIDGDVSLDVGVDDDL